MAKPRSAPGFPLLIPHAIGDGETRPSSSNFRNFEVHTLELQAVSNHEAEGSQKKDQPLLPEFLLLLSDDLLSLFDDFVDQFNNLLLIFTFVALLVVRWRFGFDLRAPRVPFVDSPLA